MKLATDWRRVLRYAWSIRLIILAGLLSGVEVTLPLLGDMLPVRPGVFAGLSFFVSGSALVARLTAQKNLPGE